MLVGITFFTVFFFLLCYSRSNQACLLTTFSEGDDSRMDAVNAALDESQAVADLRLTKQQLQALRLENQHLQEQVFYITQNYTFCIF